MRLGENIKKLRMAKGMTQEQLAGALGVAVQTVSRWETAVNYPDVLMLPALCELFGVTCDHLLNIGGVAAMEQIQSERLVIREWRDSDAQALLALCQEPEIHWRKDRSIEESLETIRIWSKYQEMWPVLHKESLALIGVVGICDVNRHKQYREIECHISEPFRNKGYATEAVGCILLHAFEVMKLAAVAASIHPENAPSRRVLEKTAFPMRERYANTAETCRTARVTPSRKKTGTRTV